MNSYYFNKLIDMYYLFFALGPPPSVDQKVIAMLREFFRKRPPQEKVRELGILKGKSSQCLYICSCVNICTINFKAHDRPLKVILSMLCTLYA